MVVLHHEVVNTHRIADNFRGVKYFLYFRGQADLHEFLPHKITGYTVFKEGTLNHLLTLGVNFVLLNQFLHYTQDTMVTCCTQ